MMMNHGHYIAEVVTDTENPQEQFRKDIDEVLKNIEISESTRENISPSGSCRNLIFNALPNIHNKIGFSTSPFPGRHIVSGCSSLTENISSYVDSILKAHNESLPSYGKDTSDFITKVHNLKGIPQNAF